MSRILAELNKVKESCNSMAKYEIINLFKSMDFHQIEAPTPEIK